VLLRTVECAHSDSCRDILLIEKHKAPITPGYGRNESVGTEACGGRIILDEK
jgi:hypothetical protein